jgi:hypothetical protein
MSLPLVSASARSRSGRRVADVAVLLLSLFLLLAVHPVHGQEPDPFSVTVKVDASADTVAKARDVARLDGQRRALAALAERLSGSSAPVPQPKLGDKAITGLVASFEVANERMSAVRYLADYTFHFRPAETRRALGVSAAAVPADNRDEPKDAETADRPRPTENKAIVIVPVYQAAGETRLWDDPNPWRDSWEQASVEAGRIIVPLGDAGDLVAIDGEKARAGNTQAIAAVTRRNGGDEAVVAVAALRGSADRPAGVDVTLQHYRGGHFGEKSSRAFDAAAGESAADLLRRAVAAIAPEIVGGRQREAPQAAREDQEGALIAVLPISSLDDWLRARERLSTVPMIRRISLVTLSRQEATIEIGYAGTIEQLKSDLAQVSLDLLKGESRWRLARSGAGRAP